MRARQNSLIFEYDRQSNRHCLKLHHLMPCKCWYIGGYAICVLKPLTTHQMTLTSDHAVLKHRGCWFFCCLDCH